MSPLERLSFEDVSISEEMKGWAIILGPQNKLRGDIIRESSISSIQKVSFD